MKKKTQVSTLDTKSVILEAFLDLCAETGITQVTLQKVAKKANMAFATVRYHFAEQGVSLEDEASLYVAKKGQAYTQDSIEKARKKKGFHALKSYIDATFDWIESNPDHAKYLIYFYYVSGTKQDMPIRNDALVATARQRTTSLLHECVGRGEIKPGGNFEDIAVKVHTILYGCGVLAMSISTKEEFKLQRQNAWAIIQKLLW